MAGLFGPAGDWRDGVVEINDPGHRDGENVALEDAVPYVVALIGKPQASPGGG
ncbi:hypothetical protein [Pseudarthrobacter sp. H2]|uniref:hypothetical protein n=1 Tax=Pseudarthrobacter sp. H2 TaxID=3418415 RepID=UPI003CFA3B89